MSHILEDVLFPQQFLTVPVWLPLLCEWVHGPTNILLLNHKEHQVLKQLGDRPGGRGEGWRWAADNICSGSVLLRQCGAEEHTALSSISHYTTANVIQSS